MLFRFSALVAGSTLFLLAGSALAQTDASGGVMFPRYPILSPDGKTLVFSYQGDLWSAPTDAPQTDARRLTVHPAYEGTAAFSPDGKTLAFNSNRNGRPDVFVMPATGGEPRRLTGYSGGSALQGWAGKSGGLVLLTSSRELQRRGPAFYTVGAGAKPGRPKPLLSISSLLGGQLSPDGSRLVFAKGSGDWQRRGYHGDANADIYVYTLATKQFKQITTFDGQDLWPHWLPDGKNIVFASERDGTYNLYKQNVEGGNATQITRYKGDGVRLPSVSSDGSRAAFEVGGGIATVSLTGPGEPRLLALRVAADDKINATDVQTLTEGASEMAATPTGDQLAFVLKGDVFVVAKEGGKATRLTDAPAREDDLAWSADGKTLLYVSNADGNPELYAVTSTDPDEPDLSRSLKRTRRRLTQTPQAERSPLFSPDGKKLAFIRGKGELVLADPDGKDGKTILPGTSLSGVTFSPDGKWVAFARDDEEFNSEIYVLSTDGTGKPVNISKHPRNDVSPAWSPDGTKIFWSSERLDRQYDLYYLYLRKEDDERTSDEWVRLKDRRLRASGAARPAGTGSAGAGTGGGGGRRRGGVAAPADPAAPATQTPDPPAPATPPAPAAAPRTPPTVTIDFDEIDERVRRLTSQPGSEVGPVTAPGAEGHTLIAFRSAGAGLPELSLIDFEDGSPSAPRRLASGGGGSVQWTKDGRTLLFVGARGTLASATPTGTEARPIGFRARYSYDRRMLQAAVFEEAWETLNRDFYDPKFHGADWAALRAKYRPMAVSASDPADFYDVVRLMMGHLNSSHIGVTGAVSAFETEGVPTGALGVVWDENYTGPGLKIGRVIKGSPASRAATRLLPGEIVNAIVGATITADTDPDLLLADTVGERTPIQVTGTDGKSREVILEPTSYAAIRTLLYDEWVAGRRDLTHKRSDGKLAYLHIQAMDRGSQDKFEQGLYAEAHEKNALLIDVRDNGGGSTADYLLTMLTIPRHAYTIGRDGAPGYPQDRLPLYPWQKPAALLINQNSYSNAEIFAHAFRAIKRGPIVGIPTFGAVISTGSATLLDGSRVRTPGRGWYNPLSGENQEHSGAQPDSRVKLTPDDELAGRDPQLEEAVRLLLARSAPVTLPAPKAAK